MAVTASANFKTEFDSLVKQSYQNDTLLMGKVRTRSNVNAKTYSFPKIGKGVAQLRVAQTDVVPMNVIHSSATCTIVDWDASEYSAMEDLDKLAFDERRELMMSVSKAIGRRLDQIIIDAMAASAFATQVPSALGGTNTGLNVEKILRANRLLDQNGVPREGRCLVINARAMESALSETEIGSSDFNVMKALSMGEAKTFAGFEFIMIEDRASEGGLPIASNERNCFAMHRDAVGLAIAGGVRTATDWIPEKKSTLVSASVSAGAVTIDTDGVIDVLCWE